MVLWIEVRWDINSGVHISRRKTHAQRDACQS